MSRHNSTWLSFRAGLKDILLQEHQRSYAVFDDLKNLDLQYPQMITVIGQEMKTEVMRNLFFQSSYQEFVGNEVHLRLNPKSIHMESPVLFADCELHNAPEIIKISSERALGNVIRHPLIWHPRDASGLDSTQLAYQLYAKLIAPFSTLICLFADDFGGLSNVAKFLISWLSLTSSSSSDIPAATNPQLLILLRWEDFEKFNEDRATRAFLYELGREAEISARGLFREPGETKKRSLKDLLEAQFGSIKLVGLSPSGSERNSWQSLRTRLIRESSETQGRKKNCQVAFSARHFKAFLELSCNHFANDNVSPFSFVKASRITYPVSTEFGIHIANFLKEVDTTQLMNFAVPVISSAFMFDSYPLGMHFFHPSVVFKQFYLQYCVSPEPSKQKEFAISVEAAFRYYSFQRVSQNSNATEIHKKVLGGFAEHWEKFKGKSICYSCFARAPEDTLTCRHSLCELCVSAYGGSTTDEPWTFFVPKCPFCDARNTKAFVHKPDTAGVRALIIEGGGIRGVVPLASLKELERFIGLSMKIQDNFDICCGSSSGAIIMLGLCINHWSVDECAEQFKAQSNLAFRKRRCFDLPFLSQGYLANLLEVVLSFITDSKYSSSGITKALMEAFTGSSLLFEADSRGTKVAVVATTTFNSTTCIFTNYNGPDRRALDCGYSLVRPENSEKEFKVWEAARASSAAPPYFKSFRGYQDGGLGGHNNPIHLALWEQDIIWSRERKEPDVVLSLGTGFKKRLSTEDQDPNGSKTSFSRERCIPRLFRSFLNFFVGEVRWQEIQNSLPSHIRDRYHRLNIEFNEEEPELDDLVAMTQLSHTAQVLAHKNIYMQKCADNILASLFYLELMCMPTFEHTLFVCSIRICCRLGPSNPALKEVAGLLKDKKARFHFDFEETLPCIDEDAYRDILNGLPYSKTVILHALSLEDSLDIKIDGITTEARNISNCPYKIRAIIKDQGLDCMFGQRCRQRVSVEIAAPSKRLRVIGSGRN